MKGIWSILVMGSLMGAAGCVDMDESVDDQGLKNNSFTVTYSGQGEIADGFGGYDLQTELCGTANGADVDGPYLLWVLTSTGATSASIAGPWGTAVMTPSGSGTFKYISAWYDPTSLPGHVTATYAGKLSNAQLVISHGCRPYTHGAWCSPGFWMNAADGAWAVIGHSKTELFNADVVPAFYANGLDLGSVGCTDSDPTTSCGPTLNTVLTTTGGTYKGPAAAPYGLSPFNATGAYLTNQIPGYQFDPRFVQDDDSQTCPIDHFGTFKNP